MSKKVLCSVSVLGLGAVGQKGRVVTTTVNTIDSVITIGALVTSIAFVIATVRRRRMATRVVSLPWPVPSEAFSLLRGFYREKDGDKSDNLQCTHPWDTQRTPILWQRRPEQRKSKTGLRLV